MSSSNKLVKSEKALVKLANFLQNHEKIINVCMVDFISKDIFQNVLEKDIQKELIEASSEDLIEMPSKFMNPGLPPANDSALNDIIYIMSTLRLDSLGT